MTAFQPGDPVCHKGYPSYGTGNIESLIINPAFPSLPAKRARVRFAGISRVCFLDDLAAPGTLRFGGPAVPRLAASDGDLVA